MLNFCLEKEVKFKTIAPPLPPRSGRGSHYLTFDGVGGNPGNSIIFEKNHIS